jgi:AbrB family looped-hinge helix DNA binding protein
MPTAMLTSKGRISLPKTIRERLGLHAGDAVDFAIDDAGEVWVRAAKGDVLALQGLLHRPRRRPVSLEELDKAIGSTRGHRP